MKWIKYAWSWIGPFIISFAIAISLSTFVFQPYQVEGHSMDPTLHDEQRIYVSKLSHTLSSLPDYGDIVVIDSRVDQKRTWKDDLLDNKLLRLMIGKEDDPFIYIKRVIGKPGDVLEFKNHKVYRNGKALEEPYVKEMMNFVSDRKWIVPKNFIFVMGDNRNYSRDSREIGFIPLDHVLGKKIELK